MTDGRPDDDSTLEDGPELLKEARAGNTAAGPGYPDDDDTIAADPDRLAETDADVAPPQGHPDDDTIAADPELLKQVRSASVARRQDSSRRDLGEGSGVVGRTARGGRRGA